MVRFSDQNGRCRGGIVKGEMYLSVFEVEGPGGLRSSLGNVSDFPFPSIGFSTFSEAS
jgi:hypothetical protein